MTQPCQRLSSAVRHRLCGTGQLRRRLAGLREVLAELEPTEAALARMFLPRETPDPDRTIPGVLGEFHVDNRRWDVIAQDEYVDPETLAEAA